MFSTGLFLWGFMELGVLGAPLSPPYPAQISPLPSPHHLSHHKNNRNKKNKEKEKNTFGPRPAAGISFRLCVVKHAISDHSCKQKRWTNPNPGPLGHPKSLFLVQRVSRMIAIREAGKTFFPSIFFFCLC